jgi:uncharacterized membrane protein
MSRDTDHLSTLAIIHYVLAGLTALFSCIPVINLVVGLLILTGGTSEAEEGLGWVFVAVGTLTCATGWFAAILIFASGRCLARQRGYTFCMVVSVLLCLGVPIGTLLGVFTIVVLSRPSVKSLFT